MIIIFKTLTTQGLRERKGGKEREKREKRERARSIGCLPYSMCPNQGSSLQPIGAQDDALAAEPLTQGRLLMCARFLLLGVKTERADGSL